MHRESQRLTSYTGAISPPTTCFLDKSEVAEKQGESDHLSAQIGEHEVRAQSGGASLRGEYQLLEKSVGALRRERDNLQEDLDISNMNPKEVISEFGHRNMVGD